MKKNFDKFCDFILFIIAIILLNLVSINAYKRFDLTSRGAYSLSTSSKETVKNLEEPLSIQVFFTKDLPSPYNIIPQRLADLLQEYKANANKNFSYKFFDMDEEENVQLAGDLGLNQIQIRDIKTNEVGFKQVWMGLVLTYGNRTELYDAITTTDLMEYRITTSINKMISTVNVLSGLKGKLQLNLYCSDSMSKLGINGLNQLDSMVKAAFEEVNKANMDRLEFNKISPNESEIPALVEKYGIQGLSWDNKQMGKGSGILGLVLEHEGSFKTVNIGIARSFFGYTIVGMESTDALASSITATIKSLVSKSSDIGYTIGHSEAFLDDAQTGGAYINMALENDRYKFKQLDLSSEEISNDLACILINGPKDKFKDEELYKIDQFLMRGGNVILFADSFFEQIPTQNNYYYSQPTYTPTDTGLDKLLSAYGVTVNKDYVMDEECLKLYDQNGKDTSLYYMPLLVGKQFSNDSVISKGLGNVFFAQSSSIDVSKAQENSNLKVKILAKSSNNSWLMKDNITTYPAFIQVPRNENGDVDKSNFKSENLAVLIEGKFTSAFENAITSSSETETKDETVTMDKHISKSIQNGKLIVVSSSKMTGSFLYTLSNFMQKNMSLLEEQEFGNMGIIFIQNILDYMNGDADLCTMRNKGLSSNNTFIVEEGTFKESLSEILKYFNMIGLAVLTALAGIIVLLKIHRKKNAIRNKYNPNDSREISK